MIQANILSISTSHAHYDYDFANYLKFRKNRPNDVDFCSDIYDYALNADRICENLQRHFAFAQICET